MVPNKRQHYVPKVFLRNFADDKEIIFCYNLETDNYYPTSITKICQESFFYGEDLEIEHFLSEFEGKFGGIYSKIIFERTFYNLSRIECQDLLFSLTLQKDRTKDTRNLGIESWLYLWKNKYSELILPIVQRYISDIDDFNEYIQKHSENLWIFNIIEADINYPLLSDLDIYIVENLSEIPYIIGESPVVLNNCLSLYNDIASGLQSPGLQIWFPFHPKFALLLIDSASYFYSSMSSDIIQMKEKKDVENMNLLQFYSTGKNLFFSEKSFGDELKIFIQRNKHLKPEKGWEEETVTKLRINVTKAELHYSKLMGYNHDLKFSFIKINHKINRKLKGYQKNLVKLTQNPPIRSQELLDLVEKRDYEFYGGTIFEKGVAERVLNQIHNGVVKK